MMGRAVSEPPPCVVVQLGGPLQQPGVHVENIARIGFTPRRPPQQQGDLPVGGGVLGKIVVDDQGVAAVVPEVLAHGAAGEGRYVLQGGRLRGRGVDHDGVLHGPVAFRASTTWATVDFFWPTAT